MSTEYEEKYAGLSVTELVLGMHSLRKRIDSLKAEASELQAEHEYLSKVAVPNSMEESGMESMVIAGVGRVNLRADIYATIPADVKPDAYQWLVDNGREGLITQTVNASTLKAVIRAAIQKGEQFPEDLFKVTPYTLAVITKV